MKFCTKIFYINREDKKTYFVYDIVVYKSGDTDFTCVIYASCSVGNNKSVVFKEWVFRLLQPTSKSSAW